MRTTVTLDDDLLAEAAEMTGISARSELLEEGLRALLHRESSRRLAKLGGSVPGFIVPRRSSMLPTDRDDVASEAAAE